MPAEQADDKTIADKKSRLRRLVWIVGGVVFLTLVIFIIAQVWLVPGVIRWKVERGLSEFCEGTVEIESVEVSRSGQIYLKGIKLYDRAKRQWMLAERVQATFADWPSFRPVIIEVEVDAPNLEILASGGKFHLPLVLRSEREYSDSRFDIHKLMVRNAAITVVDTNGSKAAFENFALSATRQEGFCNILLNRVVPDASELFVIKGTINRATLESDLSFEIKHKVEEAEMNFILAALNAPEYLQTRGKLTADLKITGCLRKLTGLQATGAVKLDDWIILARDRVVTDSLSMMVKVQGRHLGFEDLKADFCRGHIKGSFYADLKPNEPVEFGGQILAIKIDMAELTTVLAAKKKATKGTMTLNYKFTADSNDLKNLQGEGLVFLDDADISVLPVIPNIFRAVGLSNYDPLTMSDTQATFTMAGPKGAHIANRVAAIKAEPGGTVNLRTKHIDAHVVAIPLKQLESLLRSIPIVDIFANLKDKLTRLHIKGQWSDPPNKLITKEPIKDIKDGTVGFLQDVVKNGGHFSQAMLEKFGILFKDKQKNKK